MTEIFAENNSKEILTQHSLEERTKKIRATSTTDSTVISIKFIAGVSLITGTARTRSGKKAKQTLVQPQHRITGMESSESEAVAVCRSVNSICIPVDNTT